MALSQSPWPWRIFNILARLTGLLFLFGGLFGVFAQIVVTAHRPLRSDDVLGIGIFGCAALVGVFVTLVRPFRPDLDGYASAFGRTGQDKRTWLTGERK
jgi:hypothetical protein